MNTVHAIKKLRKKEVRKIVTAPAPAPVEAKPKPPVMMSNAEFVTRSQARLKVTPTPRVRQILIHPSVTKAAALRKLIRRKDPLMVKNHVTAARSKHGVVQVKRMGKWVAYA